MKATALRLRDRQFDNWHSEIEDRWNYEDLMSQPDWRKDWISFDCCLFLEETNLLYCGLTSLTGDLLWTYDRERGVFHDCGYRSVACPYDAKLHRSLVRRNKTGDLYGAIALLHDVDLYWDAPGGAIIRYSPGERKFERVAIPLPHSYIQAICLDQERDVIYGITFTPERMFSYELETGVARDLGPISSGMEYIQAQNIELDDEGCAWSAWSVSRAWQNTPGTDSKRLCKYDPRCGRVHFYKTGLMNPASPGYEKVDGLFNLGSGGLFATGGNGSIYRIDTDTGEARLIGTPIPDRPSRLSSMRLGPDGAAYGVAGMEGDCEVVRFDPCAETWELLGPVRDGETRCWQIHDVSVTPDGTLYACENDNPYRSSYLWEIRL